MSDNASLGARRDAATPRGVGITVPFFVKRAQNAELWDVEGKRYVDFAGGIAVLNTGHRHPKVLAALRAQLDAFTHTAYQVASYESYVALAERLVVLTPGTHKKKATFFSTGSEAVENAVEIARAATGRAGVIAFNGAFHGRTLLTLALTGKVAPYKLAIRAVPGRHLAHPLPHGAPRRHRGPYPGGAPPALQVRHRPQARRRHPGRAGAGRGRASTRPRPS